MHGIEERSAVRRPCGLQAATRRPEQMSDIAMIAIGCASFAILILYTYTCDRL
jgi:hypothetical protein